MPTVEKCSYLGHLKTITAHKREVRRLMFKVGLYKQGFLHDFSKYSYSEFMNGAKYFQGFRSPNAFEREQKGFSSAWLHHKGRNKHHFEYWIDISGFALPVDGHINCAIKAAPMPTRYVIEMFCDRVAASKIYQGKDYRDTSALDYLLHETKYIRDYIHPDTYAFIVRLLTMLANEGEAATLHYIKHEIVLPKYTEGPYGTF